MGITSFYFFCFLAVTCGIYYIIPTKNRWICLSIFSLLFFCINSNVWTFPFLLLCILVTYVVASIIKTNCKKEIKKIALICGVIVNCGLLLVFKYSNFFIDNINVVSKLLNKPVNIPQIELAAPLGISFYTLTAIGYMLDCYWGIRTESIGLLRTALFIGFFPQLTSGPITRISQVDTLFKSDNNMSQNVFLGCQRILWGIFKKLVLSVRFKAIVDGIYSNIEIYNGIYIWIAAAFFVLELYTDFSGCMDIVLGVSECYGVYLPENFKQPFFSLDMQEFWQRWHITLGGWYREYILFPVMNTNVIKSIEGKCKKRFGRQTGRIISSAIGMLSVWILFGVWHGGKWKFIIMGLYFWLMIIIQIIMKSPMKKICSYFYIDSNTFGYRLLQRVKVFILVMVGNMFFRLQNIKSVILAIKAGFSIFNPWVIFDGSILNIGGMTECDEKIMTGGILLLFMVGLYNEKKGSLRQFISKQLFLIRIVVWISLLLACLLFGDYGPGIDAQEFLYQMF